MKTNEQLMKACQIGCNNLNNANDLLVECYGRIGKLANENERLKADAERLDWISRQYLDDLCMMLVVDADHDGEYYVEGDDGQKGYGLTLREAIDAARSAK